MRPQKRTRTIVNTGATTLALLLALGAPAAWAAPTPQPSSSATATASVPAPAQQTGGAEKTHTPKVMAQYPVAAAGYVVPIAGSGYQPNSTVTISAGDPAGNPLPGITFTPWVEGKVPSTDNLRQGRGTLTVNTDANGAFKAYVITSPYMGSSSVKITAQDTENKISAQDTLTVLGESVAELSTSVESIQAGDNQTISVSGSKFAPSYANYPITVQLVRNGQVITAETIELTGPSGDNLWSSFDDVTLSDTETLAAGEYSIQAVVPHDAKIPAEFRGRLLASKAFTVTAAAQPTPSATGTPTVSASPEPTTSEPATAPESSASPTASSSPESKSTLLPEPQETENQVPPQTPTESPLPAAEPEEPAANQPAVPERSQEQVTQTLPLFTQEKKPEATESALDQNPVWIQTSSISVEDPRVEKESDQQLKSSVVNAQGSKEAEARFAPTPEVALSGDADSANNTSAVVNLSRATAWWPILLLVVVALIIGAVTGVFISRSSQSSDER